MSVLIDPHGPDWPLGLIAVAAPGTAVGIMSLVDPTSLNDPASSNRTGATLEYPPRFQQIMFRAVKADLHGLVDSTGNVYVVRKTGSRDDPGLIVKVLKPGEEWTLSSAPANRNVLNPYRYYIDADNANDGALTVGLVQ